MRKILVITTSFPFPLYSGDKLRIYNIINHLAKKNKVDLIYTGSKENFKKKIKCINNTFFIRTEKIKRFFYMFYFFITGKPLQAGYFFSSKMKEKINAIQKNYDCIIWYKGKKLVRLQYFYYFSCYLIVKLLLFGSLFFSKYILFFIFPLYS